MNLGVPANHATGHLWHQSDLESGFRLICDVTHSIGGCLLASGFWPQAASNALPQFIRGVNESCVPEVQLTRAKDGSSGTATFIFAEPSVFEASEDLGEITGLYMLDAEGELNTIDVQVPSPLEPLHGTLRG